MTDSMLLINNNDYGILNDSILLLAKKREKVFTTLKDNGFIINDDIDEFQQIQDECIQSVNSSENMLVTIYPTQDCNLKCWYCYENHVPNTKMSDSTRDRICKYLKNTILKNSPKTLRITFFGGEPLMFFNDVAFKLAKEMKAFCESKEIVFATFFITNGSLINKDLVSKLKMINATFQITLDGNKAKHDTVRIGKKNGFPTFDKIIEGIHLILDMIDSPYKTYKKMMTVRINYDNKTLLNIDEIINALYDLPKNKIYIHLERVWQTIGQIDKEQNELFVTAYRKLINAGFNVTFGSFGRKRVSCPAEQEKYVVINYDAKIYKCNGRTLKADNSEAYINQDGEIIWNEKKNQRLERSTFDYEQCKRCKMLPICMGPCSQKCLEKKWSELDKICTLNSIDVTFKDYILLRCEQLLIQMNKK